jgi:hypothetical protein
MAKPAAPLPRAWQRMLSGRRLDLLNPSPVDVEIEDIAHGLARVARWNGQTIGSAIFSVAQHSLLVEAITGALSPGLGAKERLISLLHDAPEYVIGDMISPFKAALGVDYKDVENRILAAIHIRFALPPQSATHELQFLIKQADKAAAYFEATELAGFEREEAGRFFGVPSMSVDRYRNLISPFDAATAKIKFLERFSALLD